tara:strand:+ start:1364 stop:3868 length:2505 start_codon:yes stop_codon:yes gene_type:complete
MATIDETNIFAPQDPDTGQTYQLFNVDAIKQKQAQNKEQFNTIKEEIKAGNLDQAYEGFTQLPFADQMLLYINPVTGVPLESYEVVKFGAEAQPRFKTFKEFGFDMIDPRKKLFGGMLPSPVKVGDKGSALMSGMAGIGALGGAFDLVNVPKAILSPFVRKAPLYSKQEGTGGGGIGGLSKQEFQKQEVQRYAREGSGLEYSPTIKGLIEKAPKNLKGKSLTQWMLSNPALAKPKELEHLKVDGESIISFIESNPQMEVNQIIEKASLNKPILRNEIEYFDDPSDYDNAIGDDVLPEFETNIITTDPLDGSRFADFYNDLIKDDLDVYKEDLADHYFATRTLANPTNDFDFDKMVQELELAKNNNTSTDTLDDIISEYADELQRDNPVEQITPIGELSNLSDRAFAIGNDDTGYGIFIDGERYEDVPNFIGNETEARIQLQSAMEESELVDIIFNSNIQYKKYIDENLPGGTRYREMYYPVTYEMKQALGTSQAPSTHFGNDVVFSAIARNRRLADGRESLHMDEIQSDVHQYANSPIEEGSKEKVGYRTPEKIAEAEKKSQPLIDEANAVTNELLPQLSELKSIALNKIDEIPFGANNIDGMPSYDKTKEIFDVFDEHLNNFSTNPDFYNSMKLDDSAKKLTAQLGGIEVVKLRGEIAQKFNIFQDAREEADLILGELSRRQPNYPYKDNWYKKTIDKVLLEALENGDEAISISASYPIIDRYSGQGAEFKKKLYDELAPAYLKKLANKFGGNYKVGSLDIDDTFGAGTEKFLPQPETGLDRRRDLTKAYILEITPEMSKKITEEGLSSFALGGKVSKYKSMDKPIAGNTRYI